MYTPFIDKYFKDVADVREYTASADAILDLQAGRIDAVFDDVTFAQSMLARKENSNLTFSGPQLGGPIWGEGEAMGVPMPLAGAVHQMWVMANAVNGPSSDFTEITKIIEKWAGVEVRAKKK